VPEQPIEVDRELTTLEAGLKQLETEYNMFFAGRLPRPPWDTRNRVEAMVKRIDRLRLMNTGDRFRFETIQTRFHAFIDLWDRGLRAREEGRPGPFAQPQQPDELKTKPKRPEDRIVHVTTFSDPLAEMDKLQELYERLAEARHDVGEEAVPFHKFADLIKTQVLGLKEKGSREVAFRVAVKDGKVNFTARAMRGEKSE
jgi:hypothetical protein